MAGFGRFNPVPMRLGGGKRPHEVAYDALVKAYSENLDVSDNTIAELEAFAESRILGTAWVASKSLANQMIPARMTSGLPIWEEATNVNPDNFDSVQERRSEVAGKLRGLFNNAEPDIRDAAEEVMGVNFVAVHFTASADDTTYWPGENPGPPETPWTSNSCMVWVQVTKTGLSQERFDKLVGRLGRMLDDLIPAWMGFDIFVWDTNESAEEGFILDQSLLDETGLT
jgi:hypothetical protein